MNWKRLRLLRWLKRMLTNIKRFLRNLFRRQPTRKEFKIQSKWERLTGLVERFIRTSRGGLNMPKYQPCPECHATSRRESKTLGGANYHCRTHRQFFVKHPRGVGINA